MHIKDMDGCLIEVTDLKEAVRMAKRYAGYRHGETVFSDLDKRLAAYWTDMHEKLRAIAND